MSECIMDCSCVDDLRKTVLKIDEKSSGSVVYQTSLMSALLSGVYDGNTKISELLNRGDFGLGTFNQLDGELIALDGQAYQLSSDGTVNQAQGDKKTPFAVMTFFTPQHQHIFGRTVLRDEIHRVIDREIGTDNKFCAFRISGKFNAMKTRSVSCQYRPYKKMTEILNTQTITDFSQCCGEIVGFRTPRYLQGINIAGYHEHFITDAREGGGHVLDYILEQGTLSFGIIDRIVIDIPADSDFLNANLTPENLDADICEVEN